MNKKILHLILSFCICTNLAFAENAQPDYIKGMTQLENKMSLNIINKLQAIADNDDIVFPNAFPKEYFDNNKNSSYLYVTKNNYNSAEVIKFDYSRNNTECFTGENPDFCLPKIEPVISKYSFGKRFIVENTPHFVNSPDDTEKMEIIVKDGEYIDRKYITKLTPPTEPETYKSCIYDDAGYVTSCMSYTKDKDELVYTEQLERRRNSSDKNDIYKYIKTSPDGKKIEEYYYTSSKHIFYDDEEDIQTFSQVNDNLFKYYTKKLPDLYIETVFIRDNKGNIISEQLYDRNHRLIRDYKATYKENEKNTISNIKVNDYVNTIEWDILPIGLTDISNHPFKIRM